MNLINKLADKFAAILDKTQYVYHIKPPKLIDDKIYTLKDLKDIDKKLYNKEITKYKDRKEWIEREIPPLHCKASETINLSTLHPSKLFTLIQLLDIEPIDEHEIVKIPINMLKTQEMVLFTYDKKLEYKYKSQVASKYRECFNIPPDTVEHYIESKRDKKSPLVFEYVPHILLKGSIDISEFEIIKFDMNSIDKLL